MPQLSGTTTHANLTAAFARQCQAAVRYLWFARQADVEGRPDTAAVFRSIADGEIGHAHGHLEFLADVGDPLTERPIGDADEHLEAAVAGEMEESEGLYPAFAAAARAEGFDDIAEWFESLVAIERSHAERFGRERDEDG